MDKSKRRRKPPATGDRHGWSRARIDRAIDSLESLGLIETIKCPEGYWVRLNTDAIEGLTEPVRVVTEPITS
jgi:hypothetical protein